MRLNIRNALAAVASIVVVTITLNRFGRFWSQTIIPDCIYTGQPLWQVLFFPLVPSVTGALLAGSLFALISRESVRPIAIVVGSLVVLTPAMYAYMAFLPWPPWWYPLAWVLTGAAGMPGVVAVRGVQSWVLKWRHAT